MVLVLIAVGITVFQQGCTSPYTYSYPGHSTFTAENANRLYTGMSFDEVRAILVILTRRMTLLLEKALVNRGPVEFGCISRRKIANSDM